ncbi:MAG: hypothetical protein ACYTKD_03350 [Planctomycetota bacterium]|jgi:signal recognition particle subunit SRP54
MAKLRFTLDDMLRQFRKVRKIGLIEDVFAKMPDTWDFVPEEQEWERNFERCEAILSSMTDEERADPSLFEDEPGRRADVAERSGTSVEEVADILEQHRSLQKLIATGGPEGLAGRGAFGFPGPGNVPDPRSEMN